jgi:tRNA pseudouridine38-40 synthase
MTKLKGKMSIRKSSGLKNVKKRVNLGVQASAMSRYFMQLAYDGTHYSGWQIQPREKTIQQTLEHALSTMLGREISLTGAGRTDTGVHASYFIAHFDYDPPGSEAARQAKVHPLEEQFIFKLNRFLPPDIVVYRIWQVPVDLHARFSATSRTYHYHISRVKPLFTRAYAHHVYGKLDLGEMNRCCEIIRDTVDFTSFSKLHTDVKTNDCRILEVQWREEDGGYLFEIKADRFLRNMVRSLVGTLLDVGQGKLDQEGFRKIVEAKDRSQAGQSAPAKGLFLVHIAYENS